MYVTNVTATGTEYHPGETIYVSARLQKGLSDLRGYSVSVYTKPKSGAAHTWTKVQEQSGVIDWVPWVRYENIALPGFPAPTSPGEYQVGVVENSNVDTSRGNTVDSVIRTNGAFFPFTVTTPPPHGKAQLNIYAYPGDAEIYINGNRIGAGSVIGLNVMPGMYHIVVKKSFYQDGTQMITASPGEVIPVEITLNSIFNMGNLSTLAGYAGGGLLLVGGAYVLINRRARARAISASQTAWTKGKELGGQAYQIAGDTYTLVRDM